MTHRSLLLALCAAGFSLPAVTQAPTWTQVTTATSPTPRSEHALAYDSQRGVVVLFGGYDTSGLANDTWEYDGVDWVQVSTTNRPPARRLHAMTYDSARGVVVMNGGISSPNVTFGDTWEYDGQDWVQNVSALPPSHRTGHGMAYDPVRAKVVIFGGTSGLYPTYEYDGVSWTPVTTASSLPWRRHFGMVYDAARGRVVVHGGVIGTQRRGDTWEFDGVDWSLRPTATRLRYRHAMAYDVARGTSVFFGGGVNSAWLDASFELHGATWHPLAVAARPAPRATRMVYDAARGVSVMFGGNGGGNTYGDTWELDTGAPSTYSDAWKFGASCGSAPPEFNPTANPVLGSTASALLVLPPSTLAGVSFGTSDTSWSGGALPQSLDSLGMPGCWLLQSADIVGLPLMPTSWTPLQFTAAIPNNLALLGQRAYLQAYAWAPAQNAAQVVTSNGIAWLLGDS